MTLAIIPVLWYIPRRLFERVEPWYKEVNVDQITTGAHTSPLFHADNKQYFDIARLENTAREVVAASSLIQRCRRGDRAAAIALSRGFEPFTRDFQEAIDLRIKALKWKTVLGKVGRETLKSKLSASKNALRQLADSEMEAIFGSATECLKSMQLDEFSHWRVWRHDANNLGITDDEMDNEPILPTVQKLIEMTRTKDPVMFFAGALGSTEFMAEELGRVLSNEPRYYSLFRPVGRKDRGHAFWMEVHIANHPGVSHEDIVLDFARLFVEDSTQTREEIEEAAVHGLRLFGSAADEVEEHFCPRSSMIAAE